MFVKYTPKTPRMKVIPLLPAKSGKGDKEVFTFDNDSVTLRPGTNELTEKEWEAIQPHIKDQLGKEIMAFSVPVKTGADGKPVKAKTLKDVPVGTARKIIQACEDPKTLKKWFNQELPDEILLVLSKRMRKLKVEPEDLDDEGPNDLDDGITPENGGADAETEGEDDGEGSGTPPKKPPKKRKGKKQTETQTSESVSEDDGDGTEDEGDDSDEDDDDEIPDFDGSRQGGIDTGV
jgi:hypothetical protein